MMLDNETAKHLSQQLLAWYDIAGRKDLPWQQDKSPYRVWVSEIMLQQTQVSTVIPYFERFMQRFPSLGALAQAEVDDVLQFWAGLGYYARGRNLHKAAQQIVNAEANDLPDTLDALMALPGIGRSTAGAILSIAHKMRAPILDGNVKRVLTRLFAIEGWPGTKEIENQLWMLAETLTPLTRFDDYTQAIMDLGATCCKRSKPDCGRCPWQKTCLAYKHDKVSQLPSSKPKKSLPTRQCYMLDIRNSQNQALFIKRPPSGIWGGLWCFPQLELDYKDRDIIEYCERALWIKCQIVDKQPAFRHTFSHYHLEIQIVRLLKNSTLNQINEEDLVTWTSDFDEIGLPSPISKYLVKNA
jgi:A/G-specific adenine glycosylase